VGAAELDSREGFQNMTEVQRRMVKASLYAQQRFDRIPGTYGDKFGYGRYPNSIYSYEGDKEYAHTKKHMWDWHCTAAVYAVELENIPNRQTIHPSQFQMEDFFRDIQYKYKICSLEDLSAFKEEIRNKKMPLVLDIQLDCHSRAERGMHTALILGYNAEGSLVAWEKVGGGSEYRLSTIEDIFKTNNRPDYTWGIRPLKTNKS
jgi:hypothetical protein